MAKRISFGDLIRTTCLRILWQFAVAILLLYLIPLLTVSGEIVTSDGPSFVVEISSVFFNVFSWMYISAALVLIIGFNAIRALRIIRYEMNIVYRESVAFTEETAVTSSDVNRIERMATGRDDSLAEPLTLHEFIETRDRIDQMQKQIHRMIQNEKDQKNDLIFKVSAASHDLKTPLTVIAGNAELLQYTKLDETQRRYLADIHTASLQMTNYFDQLIGYSRTFHDDQAEWKEESAGDLAEDIRREMLFAAKDKSALTIESKIETGRTIRLHRSATIRALTNIVNNAFDHARVDHPQIRLIIEADETRLRFVICNNGEPFPADVLENYGKLFFRADKARSGPDAHYGIGLAYAKRVAELHHGDLRVRNLDEGVEVELVLGV